MRLPRLPSLVRPSLLLPIAALLGCWFGNASSSEGTSCLDGTGGAAPAPCGQEPSCPVASPCLATAEYGGKPQFTLRIAELDLMAPQALAGANGSLLQQLLAPNLPACETFGFDHGDTSWLLGFDLAHGTLTVGGSAPPVDSTKPYAFIDHTVQQGSTKYQVAPVTVPIAAPAGGPLGSTAPMDVNLPMFFPIAFFQDTLVGPSALPVHHALFTQVEVSASHDCIGRYDPSLFAAPACASQQADGSLFLHGGHLEGYMLLDELDDLIVPPLSATMCVVLTSYTATQLDATGIARCPRSGGSVTVAGDWCSTADAPATASCADALHLVADFAASAVPVQ